CGDGAAPRRGDGHGWHRLCRVVHGPVRAGLSDGAVQRQLSDRKILRASPRSRGHGYAHQRAAESRGAPAGALESQPRGVGMSRRRPRKPEPVQTSKRPGPALAATLAVVGVFLMGAAAWLIVARASTPPPAPSAAAGVTPVALPTF